MKSTVMWRSSLLNINLEREREIEEMEAKVFRRRRGFVMWRRLEELSPLGFERVFQEGNASERTSWALADEKV